MNEAQQVVANEVMMVMAKHYAEILKKSGATTEEQIRCAIDGNWNEAEDNMARLFAKSCEVIGL